MEHPTEEQQMQLVRKVAELHNITKRYRPAYKPYRWNYGVELCDRLVTEKANAIGTSNASEKLRWYQSELSQLVLPAALPKGVCHCDFHFSNVLFKNGAFQALIDFDDANYTFLTFDLAYLAEPFPPDFRWDTWSNFAPDAEEFYFTEASSILS